MSTVHGWITGYGARLDELADRSGVVPAVVPLAAVLVLAGLTDAQVREELDALEVRLRDGSDPLVGLVCALPLIRELAAIAHDGPTGLPSANPSDDT